MIKLLKLTKYRDKSSPLDRMDHTNLSISPTFEYNTRSSPSMKELKGQKMIKLLKLTKYRDKSSPLDRMDHTNLSISPTFEYNTRSSPSMKELKVRNLSACETFINNKR
ncbi:hypothetical protein J6590_002016 [Homalodisca vitripennis]|nr:hypothetical protein J6590_002016 [Homalodisca vitripennis]